MQTKFQEMLEHVPYADCTSGVERNEFMRIASNAHIFVFRPNGNDPIRLDESVSDDGIVLDLPFPVCYFEMENAFLTVGEHDPVDIISMMVNETSPKKYDYYLYSRAWGVYKVVKMNSELNGLIVESLLKRLKTDVLGEIRISERVKYRVKGNDRQIKKINSCIYVTHKKYVREAESTHRNILWNHSWDVRGHWRKLNESNHIGHDRSGNTILGYTWVRPYVKGDGELVSKIRKV